MVKIDKWDKKIIRIVKENEGIGVNQVWNIFKSKDGISQPTFLKRISVLEGDQILRMKDSMGHRHKLVTRTRRNEINRLSREYKNEIIGFQKKLRKYCKTKETLSESQKVQLCTTLQKMFFILKWSVLEVPEIFQKPSTFREIREMLDELDSDLLASFLGDSSNLLKIRDQSRQLLINEYSELVRNADDLLIGKI